MAKTLVQLLSRDRLELWAKGPDSDGRAVMARQLLPKLDLGDGHCLEVFSALEAFFFNLSATSKRQYFDGISVAFTDNTADADELFELLKRAKLTGRTRTEH
jgi:hypothetical protein